MGPASQLRQQGCPLELLHLAGTLTTCLLLQGTGSLSPASRHIGVDKAMQSAMKGKEKVT
eukprot:765017-Pelagomonas_calceolata.AAC.3